jgi:hypothetical protein
MPPWNAVKGFGEFKNDVGLTQEQIEIIADWVEGGAPEGDRGLMPSLHLPVEQIPQATRKVEVFGTTVLPSRVQALGIRVTADVQVIAIRPDGSTEPLIWSRRVNSSAPDTYWFRSRISLPARTRVRTIPPAASATLLVQ